MLLLVKSVKQSSYLKFLLVSLVILTLSCQTDGEDKIHGQVGFYLIDDYSRIGQSFQIDERSVVTKEAAFIEYEELLSYDPEAHLFRLADIAKERIENLEDLHGVPFAVKANGNLIYTGYFWQSYSSGICDWVVIDPLLVGIGDELKVQLGYPGLVQGQEIPDRRNDKRIIEIFQRDNKLK